MCEIIDNDLLHEKFSEEIIKITEEHLNYINKVINLDGKKYKDNLNISTKLTINVLQEINLIATIINNLNKKGINTTNYNTKVKHFNNFKEKALNDYGLDLEELFEIPTTEAPFANPSELYIDIDVLLTNHELSNEQKKEFYLNFMNRERIPRQEFVKRISEITKEPAKFNAQICLYYELTREEQEAILSKNKNFKFSKKYYKVLEKIGIENFSQNVIEELTLDVTKIIDQHNIKEEKKKIKIQEHYFMKYPLSKDVEIEIIKQKIGSTDFLDEDLNKYSVDDYLDD